jgi:hypothetical protein
MGVPAFKCRLYCRTKWYLLCNVDFQVYITAVPAPRYTGRFIMFSVIKNVYKKKITEPTLVELFTATGKLKTFFSLTTRNVRCVHHGWHGIHRYNIQVLATNASSWVTRHWSMQQWRISMHPCWRVCGKNLNIVLMCAQSPVVHTSNISSCQKKLFQFSCGCEQFH